MHHIACLVIHGFTGIPEETEPLIKHLKNEGYIVSAPALKGHYTGDFKDLAGVSYKDWIASAESALQALMHEHKHVVIIGFSMGGLIGLELSRRYPVSGLVTVNTPVWYIDFKKIATNILHDIRYGDYSNIKRYFRSRRRTPLSALLEFRKIVKAVKPVIKHVRTKALIIQAEDDDVAYSRSATYIYNNLHSADKKIKMCPKGGHLIWFHESCPDVLRDISGFLQATELELNSVTL